MAGIDIEAFVLAGGKSSRMGRDKGMTLLQGKPMISYILETLSKIPVPVNIVANDPAYTSFGFPVYPDSVMGKGPLGGLLTAYKNTQAQVVLLVSCDMPFISIQVVESMLSLVKKEEILVPKVKEKIHPLFGLYPVIFKQEVEDRINSNKLKMTDFVLNNRHTLVSSILQENENTFRNINDREELKIAEEKWKILE